MYRSLDCTAQQAWPVAVIFFLFSFFFLSFLSSLQIPGVGGQRHWASNSYQSGCCEIFLTSTQQTMEEVILGQHHQHEISLLMWKFNSSKIYGMPRFWTRCWNRTTRYNFLFGDYVVHSNQYTSRSLISDMTFQTLSLAFCAFSARMVSSEMSL